MVCQSRLGEVAKIRRHVRPLALAIGAGASFIGVAPAAAGTFTVASETRSATYQAAPGEANKVSLTAQARLRLQDRGVASIGFVEVGSTSCILGDPNRYECPNMAVKSAVIALGDGQDSYEDVGTSISTVVRGGAGGKQVRTGAGADQILLRNGAADEIACGAGTDSVAADPEDKVQADCESVEREAPPVGGAVDTGSRDPGPTDTATDDGGAAPEAGDAPGDGALGAALGLTLPLESVAVPTPTQAIVPLACSADQADGCRGVVILELPQRGHRSAVHAASGRHVRQQRRRTRRLGRQAFELDPGESANLGVAIRLRGHYSMVTRRRKRTKAILRVVHRDAAGKDVAVETHSVTLRFEKRKWSRRVRRGR